jgi:hypothetical protein
MKKSIIVVGFLVVAYASSLYAMKNEQELLLCQNDYGSLTSDVLEDINVQKRGFYDLVDQVRVKSESGGDRFKFESCPTCVRHICTPKQLALATVSNVCCVLVCEALVSAWLAYEEISLALVCTPYGQVAIIPTGLCFGCSMWCLAYAQDDIVMMHIIC